MARLSVWLVRNNRALCQQDVKFAGYAGNNVRLAGGLNKGDILITAGPSKFVDNQQVRLTKGGDQSDVKKKKTTKTSCQLGRMG